MKSARRDRQSLALLLAVSVLFHLLVIVAFNNMSQRDHSEQQRASFLLVEPVKIESGIREELPVAPASRQFGQAVAESPQNRAVELLPRSTLVPAVPIQNTSREISAATRGDSPHPVETARSSEQRSGDVSSPVVPGNGTRGTASVRTGQKSGDLSGVSRGNGVSTTKEPEASSERRTAYQALLKRLIEAHKYYPVAARKSRREGSCQRRLVLSRNGSLKNVEALSSCGHAFLDEAATSAIYAVGTFPPLTDDFKGAEQAFTITMTFTLHSERED